MALREYIAKRLGQLVITYLAFLTILFVMFRQLPGDPLSVYMHDGIDPQARQDAIERMGLDEPLYVQYLDYLQQLATGDFGTSFFYNAPVSDIIWLKFWNTIFLMGAAFFLAYAFGILFGGYLGWTRGSKGEKAGIVGTLIARSSPDFWIGIVVLMIFTFWLDWFPAGGMRTPAVEINGFWDRYLAWDFVYHMVLPVLTGAIYYMTTPVLLMRSSMINNLGSDFIEIKRAEGLPNRVILYKHAVRNSILPMTTVVATLVGFAIGGALVIEVVFNWPGMGRLMVNSVARNDYPLAQAVFLIMGTLVIFMNFVADIAYVYLDPRVKYD